MTVSMEKDEGLSAKDFNRLNNQNTDTAEAALEALKGEQTVSELACRFGLHPKMSRTWKKALLECVSGVFERGGKKA